MYTAAHSVEHTHCLDLHSELMLVLCGLTVHRLLRIHPASNWEELLFMHRCWLRREVGQGEDTANPERIRGLSCSGSGPCHARSLEQIESGRFTMEGYCPLGSSISDWDVSLQAMLLLLASCLLSSCKSCRSLVAADAWAAEQKRPNVIFNDYIVKGCHARWLASLAPNG